MENFAFIHKSNIINVDELVIHNTNSVTMKFSFARQIYILHFCEAIVENVFSLIKSARNFFMSIIKLLNCMFGGRH